MVAEDKSPLNPQEIIGFSTLPAGALKVKVPPFGVTPSAIVTIPPEVTLPPSPKTPPKAVFVLTTLQFDGTVTVWATLVVTPINIMTIAKCILFNNFIIIFLF